MDDLEAKSFGDSLPSIVGGCTLRPYDGRHGYSSVVVEGRRGEERLAVKIHHPPTIIATGGVEVLTGRFARQLLVRDKPHDNIVRIHGTGLDAPSGLYYLLMEWIDFPTLAQVRDRIPLGERRALIAAIASAALHLERLGLVHRDIKPDNIGVAPDFKFLKLLDLGVLRQIGTSDLTVPLKLPAFVGTTRYCPPEFIAEVNEDSTDGWRAVTFYQLGALGYEIITGKQLFAGVPHERLRDAVQIQQPKIEAPGAERDLVALVQNCLEKDWERRLKLVRWEDFSKAPAATPEARAAAARTLLERIDAARSRPTWMVDSGLTYRASRYVARLSTLIRRACQHHADLLTPREIDSEVTLSGNSVCTLQVAFPSTSSRPLRSQLVVEIRVSVLDEKADTVQLEAQAAWEKRAPWAAHVTAFRGGMESDDIQDAIESTLLAAMEGALAGRTARTEAGDEYVLLEPGS